MAAAADLGVASSIACLGHVRHHVELGSDGKSFIRGVAEEPDHCFC